MVTLITELTGMGLTMTAWVILRIVMFVDVALTTLR